MSDALNIQNYTNKRKIRYKVYHVVCLFNANHARDRVAKVRRVQCELFLLISHFDEKA